MGIFYFKDGKVWLNVGEIRDIESFSRILASKSNFYRCFSY
jgi:hypothetical protein